MCTLGSEGNSYYLPIDSFMLRATLALLAALVFLRPAYAFSPKDELVGIWRFKRGIGGPCSSLILGLRYSFHKDGRYESSAEMKSGFGQSSWKYSGTYKATDRTATAFVEGQTVGPYPYSIVEDTLIISQPEFGCKVELEREDY